MRVPTIGWAFFALVIALIIGYLLTIGIFIGSVFTPFQYGNQTHYSRQCNYLYLSGTRYKFSGAVGPTRQDVENETYFCAPFGNSN